MWWQILPSGFKLKEQEVSKCWRVKTMWLPYMWGCFDVSIYSWGTVTVTLSYCRRVLASMPVYSYPTALGGSGALFSTAPPCCLAQRLIHNSLIAQIWRRAEVFTHDKWTVSLCDVRCKDERRVFLLVVRKTETAKTKEIKNTWRIYDLTHIHVNSRLCVKWNLTHSVMSHFYCIVSLFFTLVNIQFILHELCLTS